jgi:Multicopper oxidase
VGASVLELVEEVVGPPNATNYLLNGQNMQPDGSAGTRPIWTFKTGMKYLLRFVNISIDNHFKLQLDGHTMTVITTDFVPIVPYETQTLNIGIGQRYDVIVEADQPVAAYFLRAINQVECGVNYNDGLGTANGIIIYEGAENTDPTTTYVPYTDRCEDEPIESTVPIVTKTVDSTTFVAQASNLPVNLSKVDIGGDTL